MFDGCVANNTLPCPAFLEQTIVEQHIIPALGCLTCAFLVLSPMKAIAKARQQGTLGDLNPVPWLFFALNGFVYSAYALMMSPADWYILGSAALSFLLGGYYTSSAFRLASDRTFRRFEAATYVFAVALLLLFCIVSQLTDAATRLAAIGVAGSLITALMYGAPLSTAWLVVRERSAASIHLPLVLTSTANSILWTSYGLVIDEPFLYVPIGFGVLFNAILVMLKVLFCCTTKKALAVADEQKPLYCNLQSHCGLWGCFIPSPWERAPNTGSIAIPNPLHREPHVAGTLSISTSLLPIPSLQVDSCPVCLEKIGGQTNGGNRIELSCAHVICQPCAAKCSDGGHTSCPVCRHPHLLDPSKLQLRKEEWRYVPAMHVPYKANWCQFHAYAIQSRCQCLTATPPSLPLLLLCGRRINYGRWRRGKMHGSVGEISEITSVDGPKGVQRSALFSNGQQSAQIRALNLEPFNSPTAHGKPAADKEKTEKKAKAILDLFC